jgi:hypothetical protein
MDGSHQRMNKDTSQNPKSLFNNIIVCTKVNYDEQLQAVSRTILADLKLKNRVNGESKPITTFKTEQERVAALEKEFGVKLSQEEIEAIKGRKTAVENSDPEAPSFF